MTTQDKFIHGSPVRDGKIRISLKEQHSVGQYSSTPVDVDSLDHLIEILQDMDVYLVEFKYLSYFWEGENFHDGPIGTTKITPELFEWVAEKVEGNHRFMEIYKKQKK
jgi:hypothetical protein